MPSEKAVVDQVKGQLGVLGWVAATGLRVERGGGNQGSYCALKALSQSDPKEIDA